MAQELARQEMITPEENPIMKDIMEEVTGYVEDHKDRERTMLQKVFPNRQQRYIDLAKHKTVKARYEFQLRAIQIAHEAQLQAIQEMYNDFLVQGKAKIRKDRAEFFQAQMDNLLTTLTTKSQEFINRMHSAYQQLNNIQVEGLKKRQEKLMNSIADGYYETVEKLITAFQRILDEEIQSPGGIPPRSGTMEE